MTLFASNESLTPFHWPAFNGIGLGPRWLAGSSAELSAGKPERSFPPMVIQWIFTPLSLKQEGQPVDRRMDHDLARLVEKLVCDRIAVLEQPVVVEAALVGLGAHVGSIAINDVLPFYRGVRIYATAVEHAILGRPIEIVELDRRPGLFSAGLAAGPPPNTRPPTERIWTTFPY